MINFKAYSKNGSINHSVLTDANLPEKKLFNSNLQMPETGINNNPIAPRIMNKNHRILFQENQRYELEKLRRTEVKKIIQFLYSIQFPIRLINKIIRRFNYFKVIKLYEIFNRKKNITYNLLTHAGTIEPSPKEILNKKVISFIEAGSTSGKNKFTSDSSASSAFLANKNIYSEPVNISSEQISKIQKTSSAPVGIYALPVKSGDSAIESLNKDKNIQPSLNNKVGTIKFFIESLSKFNADIANNQFLLYNYNKSNKFTTYPFEKINKLLTMSFLGMGCFISKPNIQILYKPSYNYQGTDQLLIKNKKDQLLRAPKISDIINFWSKNKLVADSSAPNKAIPLTFGNKVTHYHKKVNIQLFYYVRSENPIFTLLNQLSSKYNHIQRLMMKIFNSEISLDTGVIQNTPSVQENRLQTKNKMIEYLTEMKTKIRNEQKSIIKKNILRKYTNKFKYLGDRLSTIFDAEVELELIRLNKPYYNSYILVQNLSVESYINRFVKLVSDLFYKISFIQNLSTKKNSVSSATQDKLNSTHLADSEQSESRQIIKTLQEIQYLSLRRGGDPRSEGKELENKNNYSFPSYLTGMSIKLGGRTFKQRIVPRMTQKRIQKGSLNRSRVLYFDRARFTGKTKRGAYSFTVKMGHAF